MTEPTLTQPEPLTDLPSERTALGAAMAHTTVFESLRLLVEEDDFTREAHRLVWSAMEDMRTAGLAIDAMGVMLTLQSAGQLARAGGGAYLHTLIEAGATVYAGECARKVHEAARARRIAAVHSRMGQVLAEQAHDADALLGNMAKMAIELEVLIDEASLEDPVEGLTSWSRTWAERTMDQIRWLVPKLLLAGDVWMLLGTEGGGKSFLSRQLALCLAAGVHPLHPNQRIPAVRSLLVDLENGPEMVAYESRMLGNQVARLGEFDDELAALWHKEDGLNLRERGDAMLLERVIAQTRPQVLAIGPLYKLYRRGRDDWDTAAEETRGVLDRLRRRYGLALMIEHHMPKGEGRDRPMNPFGSSTWQKWPSIGNVVHRVGDNAWQLSEFRGTRMGTFRELPVGLQRGGALPWTPIWKREELLEMMWPNLRPKFAGGQS